MRKIVEEDIRLRSHDQHQYDEDNTEIKSTRHEYRTSTNAQPLNYESVQYAPQNLDVLRPEPRLEGNKIERASAVMNPKSQINLQTNNVSRDNAIPSEPDYSYSMQINEPVNNNYPGEVNYNYAPNRFVYANETNRI